MDTKRVPVELKPCPCGETPKDLAIVDNGQGGKWAEVSGNCCGEWSIEFRTQYFPPDSNECIALAAEAWNEAPRNTRMEASPPTPDAGTVEVIDYHTAKKAVELFEQEYVGQAQMKLWKYCIDKAMQI